MTEVGDLARKNWIRSVRGLYRYVRWLQLLTLFGVRVNALGRAHFHLRVVNQPSVLTLHDFQL